MDDFGAVGDRAAADGCAQIGRGIARNVLSAGTLVAEYSTTADQLIQKQGGPRTIDRRVWTSGAVVWRALTVALDCEPEDIKRGDHQGV